MIAKDLYLRLFPPVLSKQRDSEILICKDETRFKRSKYEELNEILKEKGQLEDTAFVGEDTMLEQIRKEMTLFEATKECPGMR